jgi:cytidine deaminase
MYNITIPITIEYLNLAELPKDERELVVAARDATHQSHSPYSNFRVGSAVKLYDGQVITGANQENASYGMTVCAERTAIFSVNNQGRKREIEKIAVTARPGSVPELGYKGPSPVAPCGACRQVIKESEDLAGIPITIIMDCYDDKKIARVVGIASLLPLAFGPADLGLTLKD